MARPRTMIDLTCAMCSKAFQRARCDHDKSLKLNCHEFYCSQTCSQRHHALKHRKLCAHCQTPITAHENRSRNAKYCSDECVAASRVRPEKSCPNCGDQFTPVGAQQAYCSRDCANAAHSTRMIGAGNSHYKDGRSYALWFQGMRPLILERDTGCAVCGKTTRPHVHHIDHDPANNVPENLVVLCHSHHIIHHKSATTPWPWLSDYAVTRSLSMTSKWKKRTTSLQKAFASITV